MRKEQPHLTRKVEFLAYVSRTLLPSECLGPSDRPCKMMYNAGQDTSGSLDPHQRVHRQWIVLADPEPVYHIRSCRLHVASSTTAILYDWEYANRQLRHLLAEKKCWGLFW